MTADRLEDDLRDYILALPAARAQGLTALGRDDDFVEMGVFDSISLLEFVMHLEKRLGIKIPGEDVDPDNFGSLAAISAYLQAHHALA
jgi:D-alanine--poly(phosphoribitol) ligase subunit 2